MFDQLSKELFEKAMELAKQGYTISEIKKALREEFGKYNAEVVKIIEEQLSIFDEIPHNLLTGVALSDVLYQNAKKMVNSASYLIADHIKSKKTIATLSKKLYEGYDFKSKEVLAVKKKLPKYIKKELQRPKNLLQLQKQIEKLRTKHLKTAYNQIFEKIDKMGEKAFENAMRVALEEKARFYADRIAHTELFRAKNYQNAVEYLQNNEISFVRYTMSVKHPMVDICDFYANLDVGYGRGIIPKEEMVTLPLHPFCRCRYVPVHNDRKLKQIKPKRIDKAIKETMQKFSQYEQARILGSREKVQLLHAGADITDIFNSVRPKYPIKRYIDELRHNADNNLRQMLEEIKSGAKLTRNRIAVGVLSAEVLSFLRSRDVPVHTKEIFINSKGLSHLSREHKKTRGAGLTEDDILKIPEILKHPSYVYFDKDKKKMNLLFCMTKECEKVIKVVVDTKHKRKNEKMTIVKTAGYIVEANIRKGGYEKIVEDTESR